MIALRGRRDLAVGPACQCKGGGGMDALGTHGPYLISSSDCVLIFCSNLCVQFFESLLQSYIYIAQ
jgi:hypothetical protein